MRAFRDFAAVLSCCLGVVSACSESEATPAPRPPNSSPAQAPARAVHDPGLLALADAFEFGRLAEVETGLLALPQGGGVEGELLRARLASARGDSIAAVRILEALEASDPRDVRVLAASAEIHATAGRAGLAEDAVRAGLALDPTSPDLRRARGVVLITKPGGAEAGLEHLLAARAADSELPYMHRPLAEAHRLVGTRALAAGDAELALRHVSAALAEVPDDPDLQLLGADVHMLREDFDRALATYEALLAAGRDVGATLAQASKTAAVAALLAHDRPKAKARFLRARELGLDADALGFGATLLADEARAELERGWQSFDAQDFDGADARFREAQRLDPHSLDARRALGTVAYARGDAATAAVQWRLVLDTARARKIDLAEPVHLDLARALFRLGRIDEVRALLEGELARQSTGPAADEAREMLARLGAPRER